MENSKEILGCVVQAADDKLAQDIVALDVRHVTPLADYFVIMQGRNDKQIEAIVGAIIEKAHERQLPVKSVEGRDGSSWVLIDLQDVIVHVFSEAERVHYQLEKMWHDAPLVSVEE